ncbi:MAG: NADH-quinone oxidoreductase subunit J [Cytophagales bacterium]|nr:NADH-quinone oxidoreductase subunit J [Cytophagales bacterium]
MNIEEILFWSFGGVALLSALGIIISRNVIHGALLLVLTLLSLAAIFILFGAEFLAVVQILVYAGGIVVLMVFGIMITKREGEGNLNASSHYLVPAILIGGLSLYLLVRVIGRFNLTNSIVEPSQVQVQEIGIQLMTTNLVAFELIAYLLLVVLVGAAFLAKIKTSA